MKLFAPQDLQHANVADAGSFGYGSQALAFGTSVQDGLFELDGGGGAPFCGAPHTGEGSHSDLFGEDNLNREVVCQGILWVGESDLKSGIDDVDDPAYRSRVIVGYFNVQVDKDGAGHGSDLQGVGVAVEVLAGVGDVVHVGRAVAQIAAQALASGNPELLANTGDVAGDLSHSLVAQDDGHLVPFVSGYTGNLHYRFGFVKGEM